MSQIQNRRELLDAELHPELRRRRELALDLFDAALKSIDPVQCTTRALVELAVRGLPQRVHVIAFGKAARGMAEAALAKLDVAQGIVIGFEEGLLGPLVLLAGEHPLPSVRAPEHGQRVVSLARSLGPDDAALVLISGGGSALLELPKRGVLLSDIQTTTRLLLERGADIRQLNAVRSALSQVKGGGLARALSRTRVYNVVISDVIGSPLESIASGPSVVASQPLRAKDVIDAFALRSALPARVRELIEREQFDLSAEPYPIITTVVAADNDTAQRAMVDAARARGLSVRRRDTYLTGEARTVGAGLGEGLDADVLICGGETTVTVRGQGRGGRNQELVLGAALGSDPTAFIAALGTDGIDGASQHAGALLDEAVLTRARSAGLDAAACLSENDSACFFEAARGAIDTGRTGTNVADLCVLLRGSL